ncbi:hypothetical protein BDZ94DRAFT_1320898 [Collybia nuda]|uniref:DNA repair protein Crb2 Tudor domain-containing protein n=1 Tax=Collybia nuda TaxID=64659 RepID=A0A9P6CLI6_9AGAR|nr:hypothetical protein BDZ94DRAFT_1320898 [Collybia nuda]
MNPHDNGSDLEESQATQVLQGLLDPGADSWSPKGSRQTVPKDRSSISKDASDSSPPRNTNIATPHYHFHGLASTQTQAQQHDDIIQPEGGSQKENITANKGNGEEAFDAMGTRSTQVLTSKISRRRSPNDELVGKALSRATKSTGGKAVSFHSPRTSKFIATSAARTTTTATPTHFPPQHPPRTPATPHIGIDQSSQDSFAGGISQDPEQAFLATSKRFEIPLSELERDIDSTGGVMSSYLTSRNERYSSLSEGRVLVAATPSNSGSSQSQSSQPSQSAFMNRHPDYTEVIVEGDGDMSLQSTQESQISSSYERYINGEPDEEPVSLPELQATQPSTQRDEDYHEEDGETNPHWNSEHGGNHISGESNINDNPTASSIPQSRNLLSLVNPKNKWRYQHYQDQAPGLGNVHKQDFGTTLLASNSDNMAAAQPSLETGFGGNMFQSNTPVIGSTNMEATQPSLEEESAQRPHRQSPDLASHRRNLDNAMQVTRSPREDESARMPPGQIPGALAPHRGGALEEIRSLSEDKRSVAHHQVADILFPNNNINTVAETQPSFDDHGTIPPRRRFPKARGYPNPSIKPSSTGGVSDDPMDIVPDSEPLRGESGESSRRSRSPTKSPAKRVLRQISPCLDINHEVRVPNSLRLNHTENEDAGTKAKFKNMQTSTKDVHQSDDGDDNDDDDDIPLAAAKPKSSARVTSLTVARKRGSKGKSREIVGISNNRERSIKSRKLDFDDTPAGGRKGKEKSKNSTIILESVLSNPGPRAPNDCEMPSVLAAKPPAIGHSWEIGVVPSSVPEQDLVDEGPSRSKPTRGRSRGRGRGKGRGGNPITSLPNVAKPVSRPRRKITVNSYAESPDEELEDDLLPYVLNASHGDEDDKTETIIDEYDEPVLESSSLKRKRVGSGSVNPTAKPKTSTKTSVPLVITPTTRAKRLRSVSSSHRGSGSKPTRVFAEWNPDHNYYPGVIHSHFKGSSYSIKFDDNDKDVVDIEKIRAYDLHVGDEVIYQQAGNRSSKVIHVNRFSDNIVSIEMNDGIREVSVKKLKISHKAIKHDWDDRRVSPDSIIPVIKNPNSKIKPNPTPPKASFHSEVSISTIPRNILSKTGIAVTTGAVGKSGIATKIRGNGGTIIDDWGTVILMEGKHTHFNNRWVIEKEEVTLAEDLDLERVFLVADAPNQKAKFLIALALGIPCLSLQWLDDSVKLGIEQPWANYMLPQGFSETLNARPTQQVDIDWGTSVRHLREIMENAVPCKLLKNMSVLCVGAELVPQPKGKTLPNTDGSMQDAHNAVVRIIMSMGARRVEAVNDLRYASAKPTSFDLVVIKEFPFCNDFDSNNTVHWQWVKDSLIASRRIPIPTWEVVEEEEFMQSQET